MLKEISRGRLIAAWFAAVAVAAASLVVLNVVPSLSTIAFLLLGSLSPPAIMLLVWRGAPPPTVAELLHSVQGRDGR